MIFRNWTYARFRASFQIRAGALAASASCLTVTDPLHAVATAQLEIRRPMQLWRGVERLIDGIAEFLGRIGWVLVLYCMVFGVTDVFLRYVMNAPSQWIGTTMQAAMVMIACTGGAYALKRDSFVKLDLFYAAGSARTKAVLDVLSASFTFLFLSVLIWKGIDAALMSIRLNQVTPTAVPIPIYPIKSAIPVAAFIVLLIVLKKFFQDIRTIFRGGEPAK